MISHTDNLLIFHAIATEGSITAAAKSLNVSKSTVSLALSKLETEAGIKLIQRSTRLLKFTEAGQQLLTHCTQIKNEIQNANASMEAFQQSVSGKIAITSPVASGQKFLPELLIAFRKQYPLISFEIELSDSKSNIISQSFDIAFSTGLQQSSSLISQHLMDFSIKLYASPVLIESKEAPEKPEDLARLDCLYHPAIPIWKFRRGSQQYTVEPHPAITANSFDLLKQIACTGRSVVALPSYLVEETMATPDLAPILPGWSLDSMPYSLIYPSKRFPSRAVSTFIEYTVRHFRKIGKPSSA